jgi:hypothetical protein
MAFAATTLRALISCPGDVDKGDLAVVHQAITRWNVLLGEQFGYVVVPVSWNDHAAAEFGEPPQDILNRQLVDVVDLGIAIFWSRLGTPTAAAESGTAEEISRLAEAGRPVSILRCTKPVPPTGDHGERARLDDYLKGLFGQALVVDYSDHAKLGSQVDTILTRMVTSHENEWSVSGRPAVAGRSAHSQVIPRVGSDSYTETDQKGRLRTKYRYKFAIDNLGTGEARDIKWQLKDIGDGPIPMIGDSRDGTGGVTGGVTVLAAGATIEYPLITLGNTGSFLCQIEWTENGKARAVETTLRV